EQSSNTASSENSTSPAKEDTPPTGNKGGTEPSKTTNQNNETGKTETAAAPIPGGEGGPMPMPGSDGGQMPMASGEGGPMPMMPMPGSDGGQMPMMPMASSEGSPMPMMPMPGSDGGQMPMMPMAQAAPMPMPMNINAMMDTGMGKVEMAPPINIQMIMPPTPSGIDGMAMMPMPQPGPAGPNPGGPVGEAPLGISTDIGNERNESFIREPEVLARVPVSALANLSPEEVASVNAIFQDSNAGIALGPPIQNPDGTFNPDRGPGGFSITDPALADPAFFVPDGQGGFAPPPDGQVIFFPPPNGQEGFPPPPDGQEGFPPPPDGQAGLLPPPDGQAGLLPPPDGQAGLLPPPDGSNGTNDECTTIEPPCDTIVSPSPGNGTIINNPDNTTTDPGATIISSPDNTTTDPEPVIITSPDNTTTNPVPVSSSPSGPAPEGSSSGLVMLITHPTPSKNIIPVSQSPALKYLVNNPDVMIHAKQLVDTRGIAPGRDYQRAMEEVALEHFNTFGHEEGRHMDGIEQSQQLSLQSATAQPLIKISESPSLQYLINNPDVMLHAQQAVRARGIRPGRDFQRAMEQQAIEHFNNFGRAEGRIGPEQ
ncbi:MAG: hypothetical protein VX049_10330, partial [Pseudomonadota bacterium]|nr:hypothetical protein [Pseudomonadota bacterium]